MPSGGPRPKYHESVRKAVEDLLGAGAQSSEIEQSLRVSQPWVSELRKLIQTFGTATPTHPSVQGRSRKIHTEAEEGILDFLDDNPTAYLDEIQDFLLTEYQITASVPTVSRCVKKLKLTHKKTTRTNTAQDDTLRARYFARIAGVPANRIVVVDESAANERTLDRRWGWSLKGTPCRVRQSGKRSERWSILPAIGINGYLDYDIFQKMLRRCVKKRGLTLCTYHLISPDLSPIEESFNGLKQWMRRNRALSQSFEGMFEGFFHLAVKLAVTSEDARGYFRSAGISVTEEDQDVDYDEL
jgi:transposase